MDNQPKFIITPLMYTLLPWIASFAFFMQTLDTSILNTALPDMARDLNESSTNMQSAIVSYALTVALFIPVSGFMSDKFGTRNVFILALGLFSFGSFCCALSPTLFILDLSRILQGIGGAMMVPVSRLVLLKSFERDKFLEAVNTSTLLGLIGPFVGPLLGGYLVQKATWHWIFLINIPIGIVGILLSYKFMPNIKGEKQPFDFKGVLLVSLGFILITSCFELISLESGNNTPFLLALIGTVALGLYIRYARKQERNQNQSLIFPLSLFSIRTFKIGAIGNLFCRFSSQSIPFLIPLCLQLHFQFSPLDSGLMLMPIAIGSLLMKSFVTPVLKRIGYRFALTISPIMIGILVVLIGFINYMPMIVLPFLLFFLGLFNSLCFTSMSTITLADLYGDKTTSGNTLMSIIQQLSIALGVAIAASLIRVFQNSFGPHQTFITAFQYTLLILGIFTCLSGLIFTLLTKEDGKNLLHK